MTRSREEELQLNNNENNGLITKIWGPHFWFSVHCVVHGYPVNPTEEQKNNYREFLISLKNVLPCKYCRESYTNFVLNDDETRLTDKDLESRDTLTKWAYKMHNRVNKKLGVTYGVSYDVHRDQFESFRAKCLPNDNGCNMPLDLKAESYRKAEMKHAPVIELEIRNKFKKYALTRGIEFEHSIEALNNLPRDHPAWEKRDKMCWKIINKMRKDGIRSVETLGSKKNLPTIEELELINLMCSTICCEELGKISELLEKFNL
jgi:hypothetical protein